VGPENAYGWDTVTHPPYSPDIAPSDYHLFPELKKHLGGMHFRTGEELKEEVFSYLRGVAREFYDSSIKKIVHRMQKCIDLNGDYVEKQGKV
jgi:histone-lysine N-methyltransferase SETMAR